MKKNVTILLALVMVMTSFFGGMSINVYANNIEPVAERFTVSDNQGMVLVCADTVESGTQRLAGSERYETAAKIATSSFPSGADKVIIVRGDDVDGMPQVIDSLFASSLAGVLDAPILLVNQTRSELPKATLDALRTLNPSDVVIIGGSGAVNESLKAQIALEVGQESVRRIEHKEEKNRYGTSVAVAEEVVALNGGKTVLITRDSNANLVDSLVAGPVAHAFGHPILLVGQDRVPKATEEFISRHNVENIYVIGGDAIVDKEVVDSLTSMVSGNVKRIAGIAGETGADRYGTSLEVAKYFFNDSASVSLVNGRSFVDAVASSILGEPILYVGGDSLVRGTVGRTFTVEDFLKGRSQVRVIGGDKVISEVVSKAVSEIVVEKVTPPADGGTTPPSNGGGTTPPADGGTTPPSNGGGTTPPADGGTTPPVDGGGETPPEEGNGAEVIVYNSHQLADAIADNDVRLIILAEDMVGELEVLREGSNSFIIDFKSYVLDGYLTITANGVDNILFKGDASPSITGDLTVEAGLASVVNSIEVGGNVNIIDVDDNSWTEDADGNKIVLSDANGARILVVGKPSSFTVSSTVAGGVTITAFNTVDIVVEAGAVVERITMTESAVGGSVVNNGTLLNLTVDTPIVLENNNGDVAVIGTGTVDVYGSAAEDVVGTIVTIVEPPTPVEPVEPTEPIDPVLLLEARDNLENTILFAEDLMNSFPVGDDYGNSREYEYGNLENALGYARDILENENHTIEELENARQYIVNKRAEFELSIKRANIQVFIDHMDAARNLVRTAKVGTEVGQVSQEAADALWAVIEGYERVTTNWSLTQEQVDLKVVNLGNAMAEFTSAIVTEPVDPDEPVEPVEPGETEPAPTIPGEPIIFEGLMVFNADFQGYEADLSGVMQSHGVSKATLMQVPLTSLPNIVESLEGLTFFLNLDGVSRIGIPADDIKEQYIVIGLYNNAEELIGYNILEVSVDSVPVVRLNNEEVVNAMPGAGYITLDLEAVREKADFSSYTTMVTGGEIPNAAETLIIHAGFSFNLVDIEPHELELGVSVTEDFPAVHVGFFNEAGDLVAFLVYVLPI